MATVQPSDTEDCKPSKVNSPTTMMQSDDRIMFAAQLRLRDFIHHVPEIGIDNL